MMQKAYFVEISGIVQSVGFRPFIYRTFLQCSGWVKNSKKGVLIYLEAPLSSREIEQKILNNMPINARIDKMKIHSYTIKKRAFNNFFIRKSEKIGDAVVSIPPDLGICDRCAKEVLDKNNRRYLHPFINCTDCGPRFSIITGSPYDRSKTTMKNFSMCSQCKEEYENPLDRRYHAQPIACNDCGPEYFFIRGKKVLCRGIDAIKQASTELRNGKVGLVKGIGGYHLICSAFNNEAIDKIKTIKRRKTKPFAVISSDIDFIKSYCFVNRQEESLLLSQIKPIVLLKVRDNSMFENIRMGSIYLGVMLPYAPIHLLLFYFSDIELLVSTSANFTEKPLIYNDKESMELCGVDFILTNNRKIIRPLEDSIVEVSNNTYVIYRYGRGFAPGVFLRKTRHNILAVGGDLKNNIALSFSNRVILSQYTGDLIEYENYLRFSEKIDDFLKFFNFQPDVVVCDKHPEYLSAHYASENFKNIIKVQHHKAHFASVLLEHNISSDAIGIVMDGTGFGEDGNVWGGEFFIKTDKSIERVGNIEYMPFAFSDKAIKEPYRLAILWLLSFGVKRHRLFNKYPKIVKVSRHVSSVKTSSAGRLFDVVSVLLGVKEVSDYEAEAAISLMNIAAENNATNLLEYQLNGFNIDFSPAIKEIANLSDMTKNGEYAAAFHNTFVDAIVKNTINISKATNIKTVTLSGGVFQNGIILSGIYKHLISNGFNVFLNSKCPINDGGLAIGQIWFGESV